MNELAYYNRQKEPWSDKETQEIRNKYETKGMTISEIADIHHRTPGSIGHKVKNIGLVEHFTLSRGYIDYKNSKLYKEIISTSIIQSKLNKVVDKVPTIRRRDEIRMMRNEIDELKKDVKEMLRLMNALYDFETQA